MKIQFLILVVGLCGLIYACQKCELLEQDIVYPPNPDPCPGPSFINYHDPFTSEIEFFFAEVPKPVPDPFTFIPKDGPDDILNLFFYWPSNFSAFDKTSNSYVYEYLFSQIEPKTVTFQHHNITTGVTTLTNSNDLYASPVFLKGQLYGIHLIRDATFVQYEIWKLNPLTGVKTGVFSSGTFTTDSPASMETMSSSSDGDDMIYFLSGVHLIEGKISSGTSKHIEIGPSYDPMTNQIWYYGLEYQDSSKNLITLVSFLENVDVRVTQLAVFESIDPPILSGLFNISASLPVTDTYIDALYYSTTYDPCENMYFISERSDTSTTNLIEIDLDFATSSLRIQTVDKLWYGWQFPDAK